jgi:hypothetical protein
MTRTLRSTLLTAVLGASVTGALAARADAPPVQRDAVAQTTDQRDRILKDLYKSYGGGDTSQQLNNENARKPDNEHNLGKDVSRDVGESVGHVVTDIDRATFDAQCRRVGHGDKPILASDRQNDFFARADVKASCEDVARLDLRIDQLKGHGEKK